MSILAYDLLARELDVSRIELLGGRCISRRLHRQIKIKTGRGGRWMAREAGMRRDVEVVQAVRHAVGHTAKLMMDTNFGYHGRLDLLESFIRETLSAWL
jgi:hypothetical protein